LIALLDYSKKFHKFGQKRYDDTSILLIGILEFGFNEKEGFDGGVKSINRINKIHSNFNITNNDYLYVLSTFMFTIPEFIGK
jgi:hypothetical protein